MDGILQLIGSKSKLPQWTANQKVRKLSRKTPAQGYPCNCGQSEFVFFLSCSSLTVDTFCCFLSTSAPPPLKSFSPAISIVLSLSHRLCTLHHFYITLTLSFCSVFLCLIHYFGCPVSLQFPLYLFNVTISVFHPLPVCLISPFLSSSRVKLVVTLCL